MTKAHSVRAASTYRLMGPEWMASMEREAPHGDPTVTLTGPIVKVQSHRIKLPDFRKAVKRGAKLMDAKMPGWWQHINTVSLDLRSESHCVLGQTWRHYSEGQAYVPRSNFRSFAARLFGTSEVDESRDQSSRYGFNISGDDGKRLNYQIGFQTGDLQRAVWQAAWEELTREWLRQVRKREVAAAKVVSV